MCNHSPNKARALTSMSFLRQHPSPRGQSPAADPLLQGGLAEFALRRGSVYTLVESDLWSNMVSGLETSLDRGVSLAEGLVCQLKGLAFPIPPPRCVRMYVMVVTC